MDWSDIAGAAKSIFSTGSEIFTTGYNILSGAASAAAPYLTLATDIRKAGAYKAAGYYEKGLYDVQAIDTLSMAGMRADQEEKYASLQAGRRLKQAEVESRNFQIQSNNLLRNLERTNAAARARAAANGIDAFSGSAGTVQDYNIRVGMFDVGISDLNALMAKVTGYEDAQSMLIAGKEQAALTRYGAERQAAQLRMAGDYAVKKAGLLYDATLAGAGIRFATTVTNPFSQDIRWLNYH